MNDLGVRKAFAEPAAEVGVLFDDDAAACAVRLPQHLLRDGARARAEFDDAARPSPVDAHQHAPCELIRTWHDGADARALAAEFGKEEPDIGEARWGGLQRHRLSGRRSNFDSAANIN